jgi:hypothetical protein
LGGSKNKPIQAKLKQVARKTIFLEKKATTDSSPITRSRKLGRSQNKGSKKVKVCFMF